MFFFPPSPFGEFISSQAMPQYIPRRLVGEFPNPPLTDFQSGYAPFGRLMKCCQEYGIDFFPRNNKEGAPLFDNGTPFGQKHLSCFFFIMILLIFFSDTQDLIDIVFCYLVLRHAVLCFIVFFIGCFLFCKKFLEFCVQLLHCRKFL